MTAPDFDAMARERLFGLGLPRRVRECASLAFFLRSVHAQGREALMRELVPTLIAKTRLTAGQISDVLLALLPPDQP